MISEMELRKIVEQVLTEMGSNMSEALIKKDSEKCCDTNDTLNDIDEDIYDITKIDLRKQLLVPNTENPQALLKMKTNTPARIGVWRAGPRYKTETMLRFRADHAAAQDAVYRCFTRFFR